MYIIHIIIVDIAEMLPKCYENIVIL
jgi:hypothetical protein